jgi:PAS domain-containing protein
MKGFRPTWMRYGVALLAMALAIVLRLLLNPLLGDHFPFVTLLFAVLVAAWYGGFGPALAATLTGAVASSVFLLPPRAEAVLEGFENQAGAVLYLLVGVGVAALGGSMRTAQLRAEAHATEAVQRQQQLMEEVRQRQQAEDALRHSQQRFETFMNHSPTTVYIKDEKGRYLYVNPLLERLFHLHRADWLGKTDHELFSTEWAEQYHEDDQKVMASGQMLRARSL